MSEESYNDLLKDYGAWLKRTKEREARDPLWGPMPESADAYLESADAYFRDLNREPEPEPPLPDNVIPFRRRRA